LPGDIAGPLDQKAQYGSMNEYERTKQEYDMRILNDDKELELLKQKKMEERDMVAEVFNRDMNLVNRELSMIEVNGKKQVQRIKQE